jgi:hypothetical protein
MLLAAKRRLAAHPDPRTPVPPELCRGSLGAGVDGARVKAAVGLGDVLGHQAAVGVVAAHGGG